MDKEELLKLNREEYENNKEDEREIIVSDKSTKGTLVCMVIIATIFAIVRVTKGESMLDLMVTVCVSMAVSNVYRYKHLKKREYIISAIILLIVSLIGLCAYFMGK